MLDGCELPWFSHAKHLGHKISFKINGLSEDLRGHSTQKLVNFRYLYKKYILTYFYAEFNEELDFGIGITRKCS